MRVNIGTVPSQIVDEFNVSLRLDSAILVLSTTTDESVDQAEVLSLAAMAQAFFVSITLESRQLGRVEACHELWTEAAQLFDGLSGAWVQVDSDDPQIEWLRSRLTHFASLARDRVALYDVSERQRLANAARRDVGLETAFSERPD